MGVGRLLVVDDEDNYRSMLTAALGHLGFEVTAVATGRDAIETAGTLRPDLVVLDVMLEDLDGFEVCRRLRAAGDATPILFLTAKRETKDRVEGLMLGGDDYLVKPFSLEELAARITAVLRRTGTPADGSQLRCADLELDEDAHRVTRAGAEVSLSPTEFRLLHYLLLNQGRVLSRPQILDNVWGYDFDGQRGVVDNYIGYLRRKVDDTEPRLIHTIRGVGYTLREQWPPGGGVRADDAARPPPARHGPRGRRPAAVVVPRHAGHRALPDRPGRRPAPIGRHLGR